jgi:hypothetical protein
VKAKARTIMSSQDDSSTFESNKDASPSKRESAKPKPSFLIHVGRGRRDRDDEALLKEAL